MSGRSNLATVRNPILALPAWNKLRDLSPTERDAVIAVLQDIRREAADRAEISWRKHKAPMAAYWKAVSVYARHIIIAIRKADT